MKVKSKNIRILMIRAVKFTVCALIISTQCQYSCFSLGCLKVYVCSVYNEFYSLLPFYTTLLVTGKVSSGVS